MCDLKKNVLNIKIGHIWAKTASSSVLQDYLLPFYYYMSTIWPTMWGQVCNISVGSFSFYFKGTVKHFGEICVSDEDEDEEDVEEAGLYTGGLKAKKGCI